MPLAVVALAFLVVGIRARRTHFDCPQCGFRFKLPWARYALAPHRMFKRWAKCPRCGATGFMTPMGDKR